MKEKTRVVNIKHDDYDVFIGRPSLWGNPFKIGIHGDRNEVIEKFRELIKSQPYLIEAAKEMLKGKTLGCHCKPLPCHGDVWCEILNEEDADE